MSMESRREVIFNPDGIDLRGKKSGEFKTTCPFCSSERKNKKDPCLSVNLDKGVWNCKNCGRKGSMTRTVPNETKVYVRPPKKTNTSISDEVVLWLRSRGISLSTAQRMMITGIKTSRGNDAIEFNYYDHGELINIKTRQISEKAFAQVKDAKLIWYNIDAFDTNDSIVITEGEMDVLSLTEAGISNCVSVPGGASNLDFFDGNDYDHIESFILATDNDAPGRRMRDGLIQKLGDYRCKTVDWKDCKDANEYLQKYGEEDLRRAIKEAKPVPVDGVIKASDVYAEIMDLKAHGLRPGLVTAHDKLNEHITWETGRLCVVTGIPGHGKSEFMDEIVENLNVMYGWKAGFFSPENFPVQLHISKIMAKITGRWISQLSDDEIIEAVEYINENFYWVVPSDEEYTLDAILDKAKFLVKSHGIKIFVIDPWNTIDHQLGTMSETQYTSKALGKIQHFARRNGVLMIVVAHPTKIKKNEGSGKFEVPNLYSISGSAHFFNKPDYGITVYRDDETDDVEVFIQKMKWRHLGKKGNVKFRNNPSNGRYTERSPGSAVIFDETNHLK